MWSEVTEAKGSTEGNTAGRPISEESAADPLGFGEFRKWIGLKLN